MSKQQEKYPIFEVIEWLKGYIYGLMSVTLPGDNKAFEAVSESIKLIQSNINGSPLQEKPSQQIDMDNFINAVDTAVYYGKILKEEKDETFLENIGLPCRVLELEGLYEILVNPVSEKPDISEGLTNE